MISVQNISMTYGAPPRTVLESIDLHIEEGEFVCVLGETGCGKSTLLRLILGSERPTSGRVLIDGVEHEQPDRTRGYVPQKYSLFPDKTVIDNITFGAEVSEFRLWGRLTPPYYGRRKEFREQAMGYLRSIGLREADAKKYPDQLSGGMQQRVAIAQALMTNPRILLMDEAFSALDPATRRGMQTLIRSLWESLGTTILFVTHNTQEALHLAGRVIVLAKETPDCGSHIALDLKMPARCGADEEAHLTRLLEQTSQGFARDEAPPQTPALSGI
jgi:NitT/TauT family transport system ATP-binding protein